MQEYYVVTSSQVKAYHTKCAEQLEGKAEEAQAKLEKIPAELRDQCQRGMLEHFAREAEDHRLLEKAVETGKRFPATRHEYLTIIRGASTDSYLDIQPMTESRGR